MRTALLPFLFIFNTQLLLMDVSFFEAIIIFIVATGAMLVFTAAMQGYFLAKSRIYETIALLLVAFTLFRPGFWMDQVVSPYDWQDPSSLVEALDASQTGDVLRARIDGLDEYGAPITFVANIPVKEDGTGEERLESFGLLLFEQDGEVIVDGTSYNSPASDAGFDFDQKIMEIGVPNEQPPKELMWIPGLMLLLVVGFLQRRRNARSGDPSAGGSSQAAA
jgi:hypothetical protein